MTAVGITIFISQLVPILGLEQGLTKQHGASSSVVDKATYLVTHFSHAHRLTMLVSAAAFAVLVGGRAVKKLLARRERRWRWVKFVPEVLAVVVVSTCASLSSSLTAGAPPQEPH